MKGVLTGLCLVMGLALWGRVPCFQAAKPVWPEGRAHRMNDFVQFRGTFETKAGERPVLRITGSSVYRIKLNGRYLGYGPARAAKGFFRVDEWPLGDLKPGRQELSIDVSAYNCNTYYIPEWPGFLQAEVTCGARVLAATGVNGAFVAYETGRVANCSRYSFQRGFGEAYRLLQEPSNRPLKLADQPPVRLIERIAPLPDVSTFTVPPPFARTRVTLDQTVQYRPMRFIEFDPQTFKAYPPKTLSVNLWRDLKGLRIDEQKEMAAEASARQRLRVGAGRVYDLGLNETGFPELQVKCHTAGRIMITFDEILRDGKVDPCRYGVANAVSWELAPGIYTLDAFEAYTLRYLHVFVLDGEMTVDQIQFRRYKHPEARAAAFESSDPEVDKIFVAARETFAQNAVDGFMDCPSRERAGWLCDSFFTGRSSLLLTGKTDMERLFLQNFLLPETFDGLPEGMLPMCYPADHPNGNFIPNWAMWFVIELDEYLARSGDRELVDAFKPRVLALIAYLKKFRNADGLLEKLPAWVFVEWSKANDLVQDVNYPSNMTWAEVLDCVARLYGMPELAVEARAVRETVRQQSWTGKWFCDNAYRQPDGTLKLSGQCTETCQYYAFMFKTATAERDPALWNTLLTDFGPDRKKTKKHPEVFFANAFIGNYLRLELLSRAGLGRQLLAETKGYFTYMAERTGTLWEHDDVSASCNHGFASHAAVFYVKNVLGVLSVDARTRQVTVCETDVPLTRCRAVLPVPGGTVTYGWKKEKGKTVTSFSGPDGWRVVRRP